MAPWYMISRVYSKLGYPYPVLVMLAMLGVWTLSGTLIAWDSTSKQAATPGAIAFVVVALLCQLALLLATCWLHERVRAKHGIEGSRATDLISSCCCSSVALASMDRQLDATVHEPTNIPTPNISRRDHWTISVCGWDKSLRGKWPEFCCAVVQPWFMQARMLHRIGRFSVLRVMLLVLLELMVSVSFVALSAFTEHTLLKVLCAVLSSLNIVANAYSLWIRYTVRETLGIHGSLAEDCSILVCCSPCSLVQMDQETEPIKEASTGAEKKTTPFRIASTVDRAASAIRNQDMPGANLQSSSSSSRTRGTSSKTYDGF